jgi:hypothetical protein
VKPVLKRYIWESGLDIIAPLKCGTRWLEGLDVDTRIHRSGFHIDNLKENVHSGTTFIWRGVREHFLSALRTELATSTEKSVLDIVLEMESGLCDHWSGELYRELYSLWSKTPFRFLKLRAISELTPSAREMGWTSTMYAFALPTKWDSDEAVLGSLSPKHLIRLNRLIGEEERWLKMMIEAQYSEKNWEAYSDLEDSRLEMLCKSMDLKAEVEQLNKTLVNQLELQRIKHSKEINELKESNSKMESKVELAENILGRKIIKLI